ncbi:MAG: PAS domain-containing protein [Myxococcota bacterium]
MNDLLASLEALHDLVVVVDGEGVCRHAGPRPLPAGIFREDPAPGARLADVLEADARGPFLDASCAAEPRTFEVRCSHPNRRFRIRTSRSGPLRTFLGTVEASDPLRAPVAQDPVLDFMLRHLEVGVLVQGPNAEILMSNEAALRLLGLSEAQLLGRSSFDPRWGVVHEDGSDFPGPTHPVPRAIATKEPVRDVLMGVYRPLTDDRLWLVVDAIPELDARGDIVRVLCTFRDITARRDAEAARVRESKLLEQVFVTSVTGIVVLERSGRIAFANRAAEALLGAGNGDLEGLSQERTPWTLTDMLGAPMAAEEGVFAQVLATREPVLGRRLVLSFPDGTQRVTRLNGAPILDREGEVERVVLAMIDVSAEEQERHERERIRREAEEISRLEGLAVLAGGVAHDFNNLLVGVLGASTSALEQLPLDHPARADLELVEQGGLRARELVQQLLAYAGRAQPAARATDLGELVRETVPLLEAMVRRGAALRLEAAEDAMPVTADPTQLRQILLNLALNASQALGREGGTIVVRAGRDDVDRDRLRRAVADAERLAPGPFAWVEVQDDGAGMPELVRERMFDPFFTTKESGHGLGLAAVLGIVRSHDGFVEVDSQPSVGTRVRVALPVSGRARSVESTPPAEPKEDRISGTLLVVDDEELVRRMAQRLLKRLGARVLVAENGEQGLELLAEHREAIRGVLLDVSMPGMRGDQVLARIRESDPELGVVMMSGFSAEELPRFEGPTRFLPKPFRKQELLEALRAVLPRP